MVITPMVSYVTVLVMVLHEGYYINLRTCHVFWCSMWASIVKCGAVHISLSSPCPSAIWITNFDREKSYITTLFHTISITYLVYRINKKVQDGMNVALFLLSLKQWKVSTSRLLCCSQNCAHAHVVCMCNITYN